MVNAIKNRVMCPNFMQWVEGRCVHFWVGRTWLKRLPMGWESQSCSESWGKDRSNGEKQNEDWVEEGLSMSRRSRKETREDGQWARAQYKEGGQGSDQVMPALKDMVRSLDLISRATSSPIGVLPTRRLWFTHISSKPLPLHPFLLLPVLGLSPSPLMLQNPITFQESRGGWAGQCCLPRVPSSGTRKACWRHSINMC